MEKMLTEYLWVIIVLIIWSTPWKGMALWRSARNGQAGWFIILLIFNTMAILDILYIFIFSKWGAKNDLKPQKEEAAAQQPPTNPLPPPSDNRPMIV